MSNVAKLHTDLEAPKPTGLALLRESFPDNQISTLPKPYKKDSPKGKCSECGGYHGLPAVHLDYVGHAALTDRLLDADIEWNWKPMALTPEGLPAFDKNGGLWIWLTVCGVTRLGYGSADGKTGGDAIKEIIGDALRNSGMRFGAALALWHKGELHAHDGDAANDGEPRDPLWVTAAMTAITCLNTVAECDAWWPANIKELKSHLPDEKDAFNRVVGHLKDRKNALKDPAPREASQGADDHRRDDARETDPFDDEIPF